MQKQPENHPGDNRCGHGPLLPAAGANPEAAERGKSTLGNSLGPIVLKGRTRRKRESAWLTFGIAFYITSTYTGSIVTNQESSGQNLNYFQP
jgi:hypothetical protein